MAVYDQRAAQDFRFGQLTAAITSLDTTLNSTGFTPLPSDLTTTKYMPITLADDAAGSYETVWVTSHSGSSTAVTAVRGREGSTAQAWASGTTWRCAPTVRDGLVVATRAGLPSDAHLGLRATVSDEAVVVEKTANGWADSAPHQPGRKHGWRQLAGPLAHNNEAMISGWTADAGNPTIATMSAGSLLLNRAGVWSLVFMTWATMGQNGWRQQYLNWVSGAWAPTFTDLGGSCTHTTTAGDQYCTVSWTGYVTAAEATAPIKAYVKQTNATSGSINVNYHLLVEYLGN